MQPSPTAPGLPQPGGTAGPPARAAPCPDPTCLPVRMLLLLLRLVRTTQPSRSLGPSVNELPDTSPPGGLRLLPLPCSGEGCAGWTLLHPHPIAGARCSHLHQFSQNRWIDRRILGRIWIYGVTKGTTHRAESREHPYTPQGTSRLPTGDQPNAPRPDTRGPGAG